MVVRIVDLPALAMGCGSFFLGSQRSHVFTFSYGKTAVQNPVDEDNASLHMAHLAKL